MTIFQPIKNKKALIPLIIGGALNIAFLIYSFFGSRSIAYDIASLFAMAGTILVLLGIWLNSSTPKKEGNGKIAAWKIIILIPVLLTIAAMVMKINLIFT